MIGIYVCNRVHEKEEKEKKERKNGIKMGDNPTTLILLLDAGS